MTGKFNAAGNAETVVKRAGKTPVMVSLHLELNPAEDQMTGVISNTAWSSVLQANRTEVNPGPITGGEFALVIPAEADAPAGYLRLSNGAAGTVLVTGTLTDGAHLNRSAPMTKAGTVPLYAPLYSGRGLFLGWVTLGKEGDAATWIKPGMSGPTSVRIVK